MTISPSHPSVEERRAAWRRPGRLTRLPEQYFVALRDLVEAAAALPGEPLVDLSRGNPEVGPPQHVVDAPGAACAPQGVFEDAVHWAEETGTVVVHDSAYADLVFDGREPQSFLAAPGAKEIGVELFSMSKTYGMAGWRLGFVVGNAEIVARL